MNRGTVARAPYRGPSTLISSPETPESILNFSVPEGADLHGTLPRISRIIGHLGSRFIFLSGAMKSHPTNNQSWLHVFRIGSCQKSTPVHYYPSRLCQQSLNHVGGLNVTGAQPSPWHINRNQTPCRLAHSNIDDLAALSPPKGLTLNATNTMQQFNCW